MAALKISTPGQSVDCGNVDLAWQGGTPNYDIKILFPGGILEFPQVEGTLATWLGNTTEGVQLTFEITDSTGDSVSVNFTPTAGGLQSSCPTNEFELLYPGTTTGPLFTRTGSIVGSTPTTVTSSPITSATPTSTGVANIGGPSNVLPSSSAATTTPPPPTGSPLPDTGSKVRAGLGIGAIVGIAIGATSIIVLAVLLIFFLRKHKKRRNQHGTTRPYSSHGSLMLDDLESPRNLMSELSSLPLPPIVPYLDNLGALQPRLSPPVTPIQDAPAHRKSRYDRLPTSTPPVSAATPESAAGSARGSTDESTRIQDTSEATISDVWTTNTGRSGRRTASARNVRYETDGGVSLAGGMLGEGDNDDDDFGQTAISTLPPPYFTLAHT